MVFSSLQLRTLFIGAALAVSASYAVASTLPINPLPTPPGSKTIASAIPINPLPTPPGSKAVSA